MVMIFLVMSTPLCRFTKFARNLHTIIKVTTSRTLVGFYETIQCISYMYVSSLPMMPPKGGKIPQIKKINEVMLQHNIVQ